MFSMSVPGRRRNGATAYQRVQTVEDSECKHELSDDSCHSDEDGVVEVHVDASSALKAKRKAETEKNSFSVRLLQQGKPKREVVVESEWTVADLKQQYFSEELGEGLNVRLIFSGRLLYDECVLEDSGVRQGSGLHVAIAHSKGLQSLPNTLGMTETSTDGCGPDGFVSDATLARMLQAEERRNASADSDPFAAPNVDNGSIVQQMRQGESTDFACGFFMGLMLGVWVFLLLIFNRRYARSRRFRLGVLVGVMFNLLADGLTRDQAGRHHHSDGGKDSADSPPQGATSADDS